eukprot:SAG11_NODE_3427_length_2454_cov_9.902335_4_plen_88_part_00
MISAWVRESSCAWPNVPVFYMRAVHPRRAVWVRRSKKTRETPYGFTARTLLQPSRQSAPTSPVSGVRPSTVRGRQSLRIRIGFPGSF